MSNNEQAREDWQAILALIPADDWAARNFLLDLLREYTDHSPETNARLLDLAQQLDEGSA